MKILVTGGAGYIGSHICRLLNEKNLEVLAFDNLSTGFRESLSDDIEFVQGDIRDTAALEKIFKATSIGAVIHCAAKLLIAESFSLVEEYYDTNVNGLISLLKVCRQQEVDKLVFSSSSSIYGNAPRSSLITEDDPVAPLNPYGATKYMGERILKDFEKAYGIRSTSLRYFNAAGAADDLKNGQRGAKATHIVKVAAQAAVGKRDHVAIYGNDYPTKDGTCIRDYIHVEDLAEVHYLALADLQSGATGDVLNVGYGRGFSVSEIIQVMKKVSGSDFPVRHSPRRPGDAASLVANTTKVQNKFKWIPKRDSIENICRSAFLWEGL